MYVRIDHQFMKLIEMKKIIGYPTEKHKKTGKPHKRKQVISLIRAP